MAIEIANVSGYGEYFGTTFDKQNRTHIMTPGQEKMHEGRNISEWLPVKWIKWKPLDWNIPIPSDSNLILKLEYGDSFFQPDKQWKDVCPYQYGKLNGFCNEKKIQSDHYQCNRFKELHKSTKRRLISLVELFPKSPKVKHVSNQV